MNPLRIVQFVSRVRSCDGCCAGCRALAVELLEGPDSIEIVTCGLCGFPKLAELPCPCEAFVGQAANPAALRFHQQSKGAA